MTCHPWVARLTVGAILVCCHVTPGRAQAAAADPLAAHLLSTAGVQWRSAEGPHLTVHVVAGGEAEADIQAITDTVTAIRRALLAQLGILRPDSTRAHVFFVNSRDAMRHLTGRPLMGFVQRGEPTGVFIYSRLFNVAALLRHELTHLYTFQNWGSPGAGAWLVEGIAIWAGGVCQGHTPDELAAGVKARGALVPLSDLARRFRELPEEVAMPMAGSITGFLIAREGLEGVHARWTRAPEGHPLGRDGPSLESAWIAHLDSVRAATLDVPRMLRAGC